MKGVRRESRRREKNGNGWRAEGDGIKNIEKGKGKTRVRKGERNRKVRSDCDGEAMGKGKVRTSCNPGPLAANASTKLGP